MSTPQATPRITSNELAATLAFLACAVIAMEFTRATGNVSLVWPANALAAALLTRDGRVLRLRAALALWGAGTLANLLPGLDDAITAGAFAASNVFEIWLTTRLLCAAWRDGPPVVDLALGGRILLLAGVCAPAAAAVPGALAMNAFLGVPIFTAAATWWQSSVCGAALAAPVVYLYSRGDWQALWTRTHRHLIIALGIASLVVTALATRYVEHSFIVVVAPLVLAALGLGALGAALLCTLAGVELLALSLAGVGPAGMGEAGLPLLPMVLLLIVPVIVGVVVNDRRRAIQAHRASQRWMQQLLEQSPIGMCLLTLEGIWELSNAALQDMLGYPAEALHGRQNLELFVPEEFAAGKARALQLLKGDRPAYTAERRFRRHDGRWIWTRCTTTLMRDSDGKPVRFIVQVENLAEQRRAEQALAIERERLDTTLRAITDAVFVTDVAGRITYQNPAAETLLASPASGIRGRLLDEVLLIEPSGGEGPQVDIAKLCATRDQVVRRESPGILRLADGGTRYVEESASPLHDADGAISGVVVVLRDVRSQFEREQQLRRDAELDRLTGLANRRALEVRIAAAIRRCAALGSAASLLVIDLDHFKRINDQAGHACGDEMLRQVAAAMRRSARSSDMIARMGGDEFAVVLDDCGEARAREIAGELLRNVLSVRVAHDGVQYSVGASVGGATIGGSGHTSADLSEREWIESADRACYAAKTAGRAQIRFAGAA